MSNMHPPANQRCQIYIGDPDHMDPDGRDLSRCENEGDHWEKWGGCQCAVPDSEFCEGDYLSWECTGGHVAGTAVTPC